MRVVAYARPVLERDTMMFVGALAQPTLFRVVTLLAKAREGACHPGRLPRRHANRAIAWRAAGGARKAGVVKARQGGRTATYVANEEVLLGLGEYFASVVRRNS